MVKNDRNRHFEPKKGHNQQTNRFQNINLKQKSKLNRHNQFIFA